MACLRKEAARLDDRKTPANEVGSAIYFNCRGKPGSTKPANRSLTTAKAIAAGKFNASGKTSDKKKSDQ